MSFLTQRRARHEMLALRGDLQTPMAGVGCRRVSVFSPQASKTTTLAMALYVLAENRGDQVVGVDANPDKGKLRMRLCPADAAPAPYGLSDLIAVLELDASRPAEQRTLRTAADLQPALENTPARMLRLICNSAAQPEVIAAHTSEQYARALDLLSDWFGVLGIDIGRSQTDAATSASLRVADHLLVPFEADGTSMNLVLEAQEDLLRMGHAKVVSTSTLVVTGQDPASNPHTALRWLDKYADARHRQGEQPLWREVVTVPYDEAAGAVGQIIWDNLATGTQLAYTRVAASTARSFANHPLSRTGHTTRDWFTPAEPGTTEAAGPGGVVRQLRAPGDQPPADGQATDRLGT